ncbi:MAG: hypothetical protein COV66_07705 [Nitrospinae bacterium CG11_big_fil_rev_8_21_14_0_20_45_15]|nr:MAG: hypothetical protein COV66_07705 [Nitrospinae bacterium CG11_big_fil_rev_8_21_14_0_20_45_15]
MIGIKTPNLFTYAYSELSQDAFICWLLEWARLENKEENEQLHNCGINLINCFFDKHHKSKPERYEDIKILRQTENIDILIILNNKYVILIEDKVGTSDHSNQLVRYFNQIKDKPEYENENILPIYFKTHDQADYKIIQENGYQVFTRSDFLEILNKGHELGVQNSIFSDYRDHLLGIEERVNNYLTTPICADSHWDWEAWVGLFIKLQNALSEKGSWGYVPNQTGGFWAFWWAIRSDDTGEQYIQLEENSLCFKIFVNEKNEDKRKLLRQQWNEKLITEGEKQSLQLTKPYRFGYGRTMTVAVLDQPDFRRTNNDGTLNLNKTIELLKKAENILKNVNLD